jgi:hypothetical protein
MTFINFKNTKKYFLLKEYVMEKTTKWKYQY